jgi:DNA polymerase kappa
MADFTKAGMQQADRAQVSQTIQEASAGSKYWQHQQQKSEKLQQQIDQMILKQSTFSLEQLQQARKLADQAVDFWEQRRNTDRSFLHVDMDAFYASVEIRDCPELQGKPVAVGTHAMLATASYEARKYGIRSAMPGFIALKLCPELTIIAPNSAKYRQVSGDIRKIFEQYDANCVAYSLDEASLEITGYLKLHPDLNPWTTAEQIRKQIFDTTRLTASVGIACSRKLAKIASDYNKPNGQFQVPAQQDEIIRFVRALPIRKISGIGRVTATILQDALGIKTVQDMYDQRHLLQLLFKESSFDFFIRTTLGISESDDVTPRERKSISKEHTFRPTNDPAELLEICSILAQQIADILCAYRCSAQTIGLKLKLDSFEIRTRARTVYTAVYEFEDINRIAQQLLRKEFPIRLRLIGVRVSKLQKQRLKQTKLDDYMILPQQDE